MVDHVGKVVLPGDIVTGFKASEKTSKVILGPGLRQETETIRATKPGILRYKEPNVYWIDSYQKRYIPVRGDTVLGIVTAKAGDIFRVDVGSSDQASLPYVAFEAATKRNRPDVKVGDIVYCRFVEANKDMEGEVVCIDSSGKSGGLGVIGRDNGYLFQVPINLTRKVLSPDCDLFKCLGKSMRYETAVGMNGRIWVKAKTVVETIAITNAICASEFMTNTQIKNMCKKLADSLAGY
ncbi:exosome complex component RRP40-like [Argopecten irradians]|uniref:exosome complex component RRP40-like n=1 Tax=Argopecten irradians TaxID=31199 RepID=UPI003714F940